MRGFPEGYTIYTAIREQCRNLHHAKNHEKTMHGFWSSLNSEGRHSHLLAHTLNTGYSICGVETGGLATE